jgi:hypothetical protein
MKSKGFIGADLTLEKQRTRRPEKMINGTGIEQSS